MDISIHGPTRGATLTDLGYEVQFKISIHAPTRGATVFSFLLKDAEKDFNPRSHEGSDDFLEHSVPHITISIHAPTRGATESEVV